MTRILSDLFGVGGFLLLIAGLWLRFGVPVALIVAGLLLLLAGIFLGHNARRGRG